MNLIFRFIFALFLTFAAIMPSLSLAQQQPEQSADEAPMTDKEAKELAIFKTAIQASIKGPAIVTLRDEAKLVLQEPYLFIPAKEGAEVLKLMGNQMDDNFVGLVVSKENYFDWFIVVDYIKAGYIRDEEAKKWNADDLLENIKSSNDEANKERRETGFSEMDIIGWIEKPQYDAAQHRLVWSILAQDRDSGTDDSPTVNYNTFALGRNGFFTLNLVSSKDTIEQDKVHAKAILSDVNFVPGKQYTDFNASTDHVAEYGIAALVAGVAAKKLGLLAVIGVALAKGSKFIVLAVLVFWKKILRFFKKTKSEDDAV